MSGQSRKARSASPKGTASELVLSAVERTPKQRASKRRFHSAEGRSAALSEVEWSERLNCLLQYRERSKQDEQKFFLQKPSKFTCQVPKQLTSLKHKAIHVAHELSPIRYS